jgi:exonuclease SbcC
MKFKKVEIQAFRAYDKVENGTFDFADPETGEIADFVSIYAPNGFGKTSFYDAVEWGFTNNINRFLRRPGKNADAAKAERTYKADFGAKDKQHIIRNKYSDPNLNGFVKLFTTISEKEIVNNIPDVRSGEPDFKFKASDTKKGTEYFQDVLLSQEWIDAFLKEDDANIRYEKFITYFGDKKLDEYYKTIVNLIKTNEANILDLRGELKKCQLELDFDGDLDILLKINSHIDVLNESYLFGFKKVDNDFTDKDFLDLSDLISAKKLDLEFAWDKIDKNDKAVERLMIGTSDDAGIAEYADRVVKYDDGVKRLSELQKTLKELESAKANQAELQRNINILDSLSKTLKEIDQIKTIYANYVNVISQQGELLGLFNVDNAKLTESKNKVSTLKLQIDQSDDRIKTILAEIESIKQQFANVELEEAVKTDLIAKQDLYTKEFQELEMALNGKIAEKKALENGMIELRQNQLYFTDRKFSLLPEALKFEFKTQISNAEGLINEQSKIESELQLIQEAITQQESLSEELQQFILKGSEIVNSMRSSHCPLCDTRFESFDDLATAINSNSALTKVMRTLVDERTNKSENLEIIRSEINKELSPLADRIQGLFNEIVEGVKVKDEQIEGLTNQQTELSEKIRANNDLFVEWKAKFNGLELEHFNSNNQAAIDILGNELLKLQSSVKLQKEQLLASEKLMHELSTTAAEREERLKQLREDQVYTSVISFFNEKFPNESISLELLEDEVKRIIEEQRMAEKKKNEVEKVLSKYAGQTITLLIDEVSESISGREQMNNDLLRVISQFEQTAESLDIKTERTFKFQQLENILKTEAAKLKQQAEKNRSIIQDLLLLEQLKENVVPYLSHQKITKQAEGIDKRISLLKNRIGKNLTNERDRISKFIHEQVESFFYEDLINVLYRKVDPHPEYKKIKFQCDFSNDKPKLNVFVTGENGDNPLVPNLYFSTAQMNILSLSIFLAKALNAEDNDGNPVNCIFIDDPIQSMDSINILSTIDLFRSIVIKFKKQIILSTHDENFHNLLRKKIPASLFNAKYIELETFGTVKTVN